MYIFNWKNIVLNHIRLEFNIKWVYNSQALLEKYHKFELYNFFYKLNNRPMLFFLRKKIHWFVNLQIWMIKYQSFHSKCPDVDSLFIRGIVIVWFGKVKIDKVHIVSTLVLNWMLLILFLPLNCSCKQCNFTFCMRICSVCTLASSVFFSVADTNDFYKN